MDGNVADAVVDDDTMTGDTMTGDAVVVISIVGISIVVEVGVVANMGRTDGFGEDTSVCVFVSIAFTILVKSVITVDVSSITPVCTWTGFSFDLMKMECKSSRDFLAELETS